MLHEAYKNPLWLSLPLVHPLPATGETSIKEVGGAIKIHSRRMPGEDLALRSLLAVLASFSVRACGCRAPHPVCPLSHKVRPVSVTSHSQRQMGLSKQDQLPGSCLRQGGCLLEGLWDLGLKRDLCSLIPKLQ